MADLPDLPAIKPCKCPPGPHKKECLTPDNRLVNWEHTQQRLQKICKRLSIKTHRPENQLLLNTIEDHRAMQHYRNLMGWLTAPCNLDKYRGNPAWWKLGPQLYKKGCEPQNYFFQLSKLEKNELPEMEYVEVPGVTKSRTLHTHMHKLEKKLKTTSKLPRCDSYCLKRLDSCILNKLQPHIPDISEVRIEGVPLRPHQGTECKGEDIFEHFYDLTSIDGIKGAIGNEEETDTTSPILIIINDQTIRKDSKGVTQTAVIFASAEHSDESEDTFQSHYLFIENKTAKALRISFSETKKPKRLQNAKSTDDANSKFYFNRNYLIILPDEKLNIPFWFKSVKSGFFELLLKMDVVPDLWQGTLNILVNLKASTVEQDCYKKVLEYENIIQKRVKNRLIKECMRDLVQQIPRKSSSVKIFSYDKASIFEAINTSFDSINNKAKYIYDKDVVDELEVFYDNVKLSYHPEVWSLRLDDLRSVTKDREAYDKKYKLEGNLEHIVETIMENKRVRSEMKLELEKVWGKPNLELLGKMGKTQEPVKKGKEEIKSQKASQKTENVKEGQKGKKAMVMVEPKRDLVTQTRSNLLEEIISKLKSPVTTKNQYAKRLKISYNLLCGYIDKTLDQISTMPIKHKLNKCNKAEIMDSYMNLTRLQDDFFINCDVDSPGFSEIISPQGAARPPPWSSEIPLGNYEERFKAFEITKPDRSGKYKFDQSCKKSIIRSSNERSIIPEEEEILEEFDYQNYYDSPEEENLDQNNDHYSNNLYCLFYNNLCDFIDDLGDAIRGLPNPETPIDTLHQIKLSKFPNIPVDSNIKIECINIKQKISEVLKSYKDEETLSPTRITPMQRGVSTKTSNVSLLISDILKAYTHLKGRKIRESDSDAKGEDGGTERQIQTSLCSDISVSFQDTLVGLDSKLEVCVCPPVDPDVCPKDTPSSYNFECKGATHLDDDSPDNVSSIDND